MSHQKVGITPDLPVWFGFIENQIGFVLPRSQQQWLVNAINITARQYDISPSDLWLAMQTDANKRQSLIDTVLITESRFFRHISALEYIVQLARLHNKNLDNQKTADFYRIWSVGCATGQEVWSLSMCLEAAGISQYQIVGTDVSQRSLDKANLGRYAFRQIEDIPKQYHRFLIQDIKDEKSLQSAQRAYYDGSEWKVADSLRKQVRFVWHNIFLPTTPVFVKQHLILCQNVLIYFREFDQRDILARLVRQCEVGGHIILAPGEAMSWRHPQMQRVAKSGLNIWQKVKKD